MRVGFVGLGRMGFLMAANLLQAGHNVTVWNRSAEPSIEFAQRFDASLAENPRMLAQQTDIVVTMLSDDAASEAVHFGDDGLFANENGAKTFIEMGTMSPEHIARLRCKADGRFVIDAPVSGSTQAAKSATLMIMVGADNKTAAPLMPIFNALGKTTICLGKPGAGSAMKLAINSIIHGLNQTVSEALTLAEAAGIALPLAYDAIQASAACAPMLNYRRDHYLDEAGQDVTFTVSLAKKDMRLAAELAAKYGIAIPQVLLNLNLLEEAERKGFGERDMASILNFMREEKQ
jgi:3-hydroxyisobutyrate dehydrogenase-like beta-hydroxyacid dehydrogenase